MTRQSLPFRGAESILDPLTLESEMRIAALAAARRAAATAQGPAPQPMESWDPIADRLALYTDPPRRRSPLSAITVSSYVASIHQAAQQLRRIPGVAAQARAADTLPALISPAEARLLQLLGGSGRIDRHGFRHFDNPALTPDPTALAPAPDPTRTALNGVGAPDPTAAPTPYTNVLDSAGHSVPVGSVPASTDGGWFGRLLDAIGSALTPPGASDTGSPQGDVSGQLGPRSTDSASPPPSYSADGGRGHGHPPLPTDNTLTQSAFDALMPLPFAGAMQDRPGKFHDQIRDELAADLRARGAIAQTEVGVVGLAPSPITRRPAPTAVDIFTQAPPRLPYAIEVKTGNNPRYTPNQQVTYPQLMAGHATSFDPKIQNFGFSIGQVLPPTPFIQYYQPYDLRIPADVRPLTRQDVIGE